MIGSSVLPNNRARTGLQSPRNVDRPSGASGGGNKDPDAENRQKEAGYPGHPPHPAHFTPLPPNFEGGEGGRARVGLRMPRMGRFSSPEVLEE